MGRRCLRVAALAALLAACETHAPHLTMPDRTVEAAAPPEEPLIEPVTPKLVPYPGLEVSYVANADADVYHLRGVFYTYSERRWYFAKSMLGPWTYVQMKYVPADLFRVRGQLPPALYGATGE